MLRNLSMTALASLSLVILMPANADAQATFYTMQVNQPTANSTIGSTFNFDVGVGWASNAPAPFNLRVEVYLVDGSGKPVGMSLVSSAPVSGQRVLATRQWPATGTATRQNIAGNAIVRFTLIDSMNVQLTGSGSLKDVPVVLSNTQQPPPP